MSRIRAVLFDVDGTLLDSNDAHAHAWLDALRGHGKNVAFDSVRSKIGMDEDGFLFDVARIDHDSVEGRSIAERCAAIFKAHYLADLGPFPGARALVDRVRSRGVPCAAIGSSTPAELADLLREAAVADLMDLALTGHDGARRGSRADLIDLALARLGVDASDAVMIGDTRYDLAASSRAGVAMIALRCGGATDRDLEGAVAIYDDPADLLVHLDESPLGLGVDDERYAMRFGGRRVAVHSV